MRHLRFTSRALLPALAALALSGCGLFNSSTDPKYDPNDPDRTVARVEANVSSITSFIEQPDNLAEFTAILYDAEGRQFFGPEVLFEGAVAPTYTPDAESSTRYRVVEVPYTAGKTYSMAVQGHAAVTPPSLAPIQITSPVSTTRTDGQGNTTPTGYFEQPAGQGVTLTWSGGDPSEPVYIIVYGDPTSTGRTNERRLYVSDDPAQSPASPENFGKPIPNTGQYTIPAQITERVLNPDGTTTTRTVNVFDNPNTRDARIFNIYVIQRRTTVDDPIRFSVLSIARAAAYVAPRSGSS